MQVNLAGSINSSYVLHAVYTMRMNLTWLSSWVFRQIFQCWQIIIQLGFRPWAGNENLLFSLIACHSRTHTRTSQGFQQENRSSRRFLFFDASSCVRSCARTFHLLPSGLNVAYYVPGGNETTHEMKNTCEKRSSPCVLGKTLGNEWPTQDINIQQTFMESRGWGRSKWRCCRVVPLGVRISWWGRFQHTAEEGCLQEEKLTSSISTTVLFPNTESANYLQF